MEVKLRCPPPPAPAVAAAAAELKLHAVLVPCPLHGHINPMLHFAHALVSHHGFVVTFVTNRHHHARLLLHHNQHAELLRFMCVDDCLPPDFDYNDLNSRWLEFRQGCANMQAPLKDLVQSLNYQNSLPVSCLVFGSFFPWAHTVATQLNIPSVFFWTQSATVFSIYYHMRLLVTNGFFPYKELPTGSKSPNDISYIPGVTRLHLANFPTFLQVEGIHDIFCKTMKEQFEMLNECSAVVINSFKELEEVAYEALQSVMPIPTVLVGPLLPWSFLQVRDNTVKNLQPEQCRNPSLGEDDKVKEIVENKRAACLEWLDRQQSQSVLYISFGTTFDPSNEILQGIAFTMIAMKQTFLWVLRHSMSSKGVAGVLPKDFGEETGEYGMIVPWAPQLEVLGHPSVGAFLSHCGWNSTMESMSMGVPLIACPVISDQTTTAAYVAEVWKIGLTIKRLHANADGNAYAQEMERMVRTVLHQDEGEMMRKRAGKFREGIIRSALQTSGSDIQKFAHAIMQLVIQKS